MSATAPEFLDLVDVQASPDRRGLPIDQAGISGLRLPFTVADVDGTTVATIVEVTAAVSVAAGQRGTHMSRLVDEFERLDGDLNIATLPIFYRRVCDRCNAARGRISIEFPWFIEKAAPVTRSRSSLDVCASYSMSQGSRQRPGVVQRIKVPVTTLCPCSKAISKYGAHNQRADVIVDLELERPLAINELVRAIEQHASCPVYGVLKRPDEKYVTEKAYENPRFVEDVVRDVYAALRPRAGVGKARVFVESHESIHNHHAFALIDDWQR